MITPLLHGLLFWTLASSLALPQQAAAQTPDLDIALDLWGQEIQNAPVSLAGASLSKANDPWEDQTEGHRLRLSSYDRPTTQKRIALAFLEDLRQYIINELRDVRRHETKEQVPDPVFVNGRLRYSDPVTKISIGLVPTETPPPAPGPFVPLKFSQILAVGRVLVRWVREFGDNEFVPSAVLRLFEGDQAEPGAAKGTLLCGITSTQVETM